MEKNEPKCFCLMFSTLSGTRTGDFDPYVVRASPTFSYGGPLPEGGGEGAPLHTESPGSLFDKVEKEDYDTF